jgi:hypothetical protein
MRFYDRVQETTTTVGTGAVTLAGALSGYRTFSSVLANGDRVPYAIVAGNEWEVGDGTFSGTTLTRDIVYASSNAGSLVSFSAGTKNVWIDQPATAVTAMGEMIAWANRQWSQ